MYISQSVGLSDNQWKNLDILAQWKPEEQELVLEKDETLKVIPSPQGKINNLGNSQAVANFFRKCAEDLLATERTSKRIFNGFVDHNVGGHLSTFPEIRNSARTLQRVCIVWQRCEVNLQKLAEKVEQRELAKGYFEFGSADASKNFKAAITKIRDDKRFTTTVNYQEHITDQMVVVTEVILQPRQKEFQERIYHIYSRQFDYSKRITIAHGISFAITNPFEVGKAGPENKKTCYDGKNTIHAELTATNWGTSDSETEVDAALVIEQVFHEVKPALISYSKEIKEKFLAFERPDYDRSGSRYCRSLFERTPQT